MKQTYRYASGSEGQLVDICELTSSTRHVFYPYKCLGCGGNMVPVIGSKMNHHFRHKSDGYRACTRETYLHRAAKRAIAQGFMAAREAGRPYELMRKEVMVCHARSRVVGSPCRIEEPKAHDLTKWFVTACEEAPIKGFVADVLLGNAAETEFLLVEVEVTHACGPEKSASGLRIFEVRVENEADISRLSKGLDALRPEVRLHGFGDAKEHTRSTCSQCPTVVTLFAVFQNGRSYFGQKPLETAVGMALRRDVIHYEFQAFDPDVAIDFVARMDAAVKEAWFGPRRVPIQSCFLCQNGKINRGLDDGSIYCFDRRKGLTHTTATDCNAYHLFPNLNALEAQRAKHEDWENNRRNARTAAWQSAKERRNSLARISQHEFHRLMKGGETSGMRPNGASDPPFQPTEHDEDGVVIETGGTPAGSYPGPADLARLSCPNSEERSDWQAKMEELKQRFKDRANVERRDTPSS